MNGDGYIFDFSLSNDKYLDVVDGPCSFRSLALKALSLEDFCVADFEDFSAVKLEDFSRVDSDSLPRGETGLEN